MAKDIIVIKAKDCCPFENQEGHAEAIQYFIKQRESINLFQFKPNKQQFVDDSPLAYFNYQSFQWYAGRYVGESNFEYNGNQYKIIVEPRFGNLQLYKMLQEVFNIRLTTSKNLIEKQNEFQLLIKQIIAFLWLNLLSKANKHGIPRHSVKRNYKGSKILGKLDIRKTIVPLKTEDKLISNYWEKSSDKNIVRILKSAYLILKSEYNISSIKTSTSAKNAIDKIFSTNVSTKVISEHDYQKVDYKNIYLSFKPVVDLSWDIIKGKNFGNNKQRDKDGLSFFIDMAEIWELYLKAILKKRLTIKGWNLKEEVIKTYQGKDFQRRIIPDIVFEKDNNILVWDAKYKRMMFEYFDYDRGDFFQIHTYINYYNQNKNVIVGGLLYPLSKELTDEKLHKNRAESLFLENNSTTSFIVDGIDYSDVVLNKLEIEEKNFLDRIEEIINQKKLVYVQNW